MASRDLPILARLQPVAVEMRLRGDWTLSAPGLAPLAGLPEVDELGPAAWSPPPAPGWSLPDHSGRATSSEELHGQPVVLNFFLGVACPFCRVQLDKFAPQLDTFRRAGIGFVGVTSDSLETLQTVTGSAPTKTESGERLLPFKVFADPDLEAFRELRAFDPFDEFPMHATVLIGPSGRMLWSHIGHAPFGHPEALLLEARRLQGLHDSSARGQK